jgi:hypothetical protein
MDACAESKDSGHGVNVLARISKLSSLGSERYLDFFAVTLDLGSCFLLAEDLVVGLGDEVVGFFGVAIECSWMRCIHSPVRRGGPGTGRPRAAGKVGDPPRGSAVPAFPS